MNVVYAIDARFGHEGIGRIAYHGASALYHADYLKLLVTLKNEQSLIPPYLIRAKRLVALLGRWFDRTSLFDSSLKSYLHEAHHLHLWNHAAVGATHTAKNLGLKVIIERASTHPLHQYQVLAAEYAKFDVSHALNRDDSLRQAEQLTLADAIVVPSQQVIDTFISQGFALDRLHVAPFGVDLEAFKPRESSKNPKDSFVYLFVGQVCLRKGIQYLLEAFTKLKLPGIQLIVAGPILPDAFAAVEPHRDNPKIKFTGNIVDTPDLYRRADVAVFPSIEEGSALVSYEAQASGLPVIATPEVGACITHEQEGLLVPARDSQALAMAMTRLFEDAALLSNMGQNARKNMEQYPWERYGRAIVTCHEALERSH